MPTRPKIFRYGALLRVRRRNEEHHALIFAQARNEIRSAEASRTALLEEQRSILEKAGKLAREQLSADTMRGHLEYSQYLGRVADTKEAHIAQLSGVAEKRRAELEQAMQSRRIVERLKEKRALAYQDYVKKMEQAFNDEVAINQAAMERRRRSKT